MTKQEFVEQLANSQKQRGLSKAAAQDVIESLFDNLSFALRRTRRFSYPGFGTFQVKKRKERRGRNPQTGESLVIKASKTVTFRPADKLKTTLN